MQVDPGACRSCGGALEITDVDDATMTVLCLNAECGESYAVEPDAFGNESMTDDPPFLVNPSEGAETDE